MTLASNLAQYLYVSMVRTARSSLKAFDMPVDQVRYTRVESNFAVAGGAPLNESLNQRILGELPVLVVIIGRTSPFHDPGNDIGIAKPRARQPNSTA